MKLQTQNFEYLINFMRHFQYCDIWGCPITNVFISVFGIIITLLRLGVLIIIIYKYLYQFNHQHRQIMIMNLKPRKDCPKQQKVCRALLTHSVIIFFFIRIVKDIIEILNCKRYTWDTAIFPITFYPVKLNCKHV